MTRALIFPREKTRFPRHVATGVLCGKEVRGRRMPSARDLLKQLRNELREPIRTNPIENLNALVDRFSESVRHWCDGAMIVLDRHRNPRWIADLPPHPERLDSQYPLPGH